MKTIGLIGGLSWESTSVYYSYLNRYVQEKLGGLHSAKCLVYSFDFEEIASLQRSGDWGLATLKMVEASKSLEQAGADLLVICTNTMHIMADAVRKACNIPLVHIVDTVTEEIKKQNLKKVGLLGTMYTMEQPFYKELLQKEGIEVIIPEEEDRRVVHDIIYKELCKGEISLSSKQSYLDIINRLAERGAEGVILGCTEIPLLIQECDTSIPLFDTTYIHAHAAARMALEKKPQLNPAR